MPTSQLSLVTAFALSGTPAAAYTVPALTTASVSAAAVNNPTGAPVLVNLYRVPNAGTADDTTRIASVTVAAGKTAPVYEMVNHKMIEGMSIYGDGAGCYLNVSGTETV